MEHGPEFHCVVLKLRFHQQCLLWTVYAYYQGNAYRSNFHMLTLFQQPLTRETHFIYVTVYTVGHKRRRGTLFLLISSSIIDQFSQFFHRRTVQTICDYYISHHALTALLHYRVKHKFSKMTKIIIMHIQKLYF